MAKKAQAISKTLEIIDKQLAVLGSDKELGYKPVNLERGSYVAGSVSFGSLAMDLFSGGGVPPGKWTTLYGPSGSGKSTTIAHVIASALDDEIPVLYYDHESGVDPIYFRNIGVFFRNEDGTLNKNFNYFQPDNGTTTYRHINRVIRELPKTADRGGKPSLLIAIDSLDAMIAEEYVENDENARLGLQAQMHGDGMRLIKGLMGSRNVSVIATNQLKLKPGVSFGNPEYEPGGQAVVFYPDLRIRQQMVGSEKEEIKERGRVMRYTNMKVMKNRQFVPFRVLHKDLGTAPALAFGRGWDRAYDGYSYLTLTDQVNLTQKKQYCLDLKGSPWDGQSFDWGALCQILFKNDFRQFVREQMADGVAFDRYFEHEKYEPKFEDPEDSGVGGASEEAEVVDGETPLEPEYEEEADDAGEFKKVKRA